ncbi:MAG: LacI family DNA-binding transcriptional regulator [Christensenella sp.]
MAITIKDVAREAGVSFSTVSKVVNNSPEISHATVTKVKEVMERMDFTPNVRASNFKKRSTKNIAFLTALKKGEAFNNPHMFEILCGAHSVLARKGYSTTLLDISRDEKQGDTLKAVISAGGYDGIIVHGSAISVDSAAMLARGSFPYIVIGKPEFESRVCWLDTNNILAGSIAAHHLLDGGVTNMAFVGGENNERISKDRLDGVMSALAERKTIVEKNNIKYTNSSIEESYIVAKELILQKSKIDGIICENNSIAIGVLRAINESGLQMPEDLQLVTFDDYPYSHIMTPSPTVVNIDVHDLGEQAASQLMRNIKNPALHVQSYITLPELIIRGTTKIKKVHM